MDSGSSGYGPKRLRGAGHPSGERQIPSHFWSRGAGSRSSPWHGTPKQARDGSSADYVDRHAHGRQPAQPDPVSSADDEHVGVQVIIAVCAGRTGRVGLAYVDIDEPERVLYTTDMLDPEYSHVLRLKQMLLGACGKQGLCVVPSRSPPELLAAAEATLDALKDSAGRFPVAVVKAADFEFEQCRQLLLLLRAEGQDPSNMSSSERELRGQAALDLNNEQLVRSAGGLIRFMEKNRAHLGDLDDPGKAIRVHRISMFSLDSMMYVDSQTLDALQVFQEDRHPSAIRGQGRAKEGLSLYGLVEPLAASYAGRATLRRWLQQPSRDIQQLNVRHAAIEELIRPRHCELLRELHRELREVRDLGGLLRRIFGCFHFDNVYDWQALLTTLEHMSAAFLLIQNSVLGTLLTALDEVTELSGDIAMVGDMLLHFVDIEASTSGGEVRVREGVDKRLDTVRDQYEEIDTHLTQVAHLERRRLLEMEVETACANELAFHYFPQLGFHVSLPNPFQENGAPENPEVMEEIKHNAPVPVQDWVYQFAGSGRLFYKCPLAARLDAEIGDLVVAARELELELLLGVVERLQRFEARLGRGAQLLSDLDALCALAVAAQHFKWNRPRLVPDAPGLLRIVKGRHPLVEATLMAHHGFIPNDTSLGITSTAEHESDAHAAKVQVVTGANLAGKSVYLKQVALIVLLAQAGSFVPAEEAEIGLCDFIFSRIKNVHSAASLCSTFGMDLAQVSLALRHSTQASLVLLDEFGKGTHPADGVALLGATVEYLCRWAAGPKAIITTHFTEVFRFGLVTEKEPALQLCSMHVVPPKEDANDITYLYKLVPGVADRSFGLECAKKAGFDEAVLSRAAEIMEALETGKPSSVPRFGIQAMAQPDVQKDQRLQASRLVVEKLCQLNVGDAAAVRKLLDCAREQHSFLSGGPA